MRPNSIAQLRAAIEAQKQVKPNQDSMHRIGDEGLSMVSSFKAPFKDQKLGAAGAINSFFTGMESSLKEANMREDRAKEQSQEKVLNWLSEMNQKAVQRNDQYETQEAGKAFVLPQVQAYLQNAGQMDPYRRQVEIQNIVRGYNSIVGENNEVLSVDGANPSIVTLKTAQGPMTIDTRTMFLAPELQQQAAFANTPAEQQRTLHDRSMNERAMALREAQFQQQQQQQQGHSVQGRGPTPQEQKDASKMADKIRAANTLLERIAAAEDIYKNPKHASTISGNTFAPIQWLQELTADTPEVIGELVTLRNLMQGDQFKAFGYRTQAEFDKIPTIDLGKGRDYNLGILAKMRESAESILKNEKETPGKTEGSNDQQEEEEPQLQRLHGPAPPQPYQQQPQQYVQQPQQSAQQPQQGNYALNAVRGLAKGAGGLVDLTNKFVGSPAAHLTGAALNTVGMAEAAEKAHELGDRFWDSQVGRQAGEAVDALTGGASHPTDKAGRIIETASEFALPVPIGPLFKAFGFALPKLAAGSHAASAIGAATALEEFKDVAPDSLIANLAKVFIGSAAGGRLLQGAKGAGAMLRGGLGEKIKPIPQEYLNIPVKNYNQDVLSIGKASLLEDTAMKAVARVLSVGAKPNPKMVEMMKERGIQLTAAATLNSKPLKFIENFLLQSTFVHNSYTKFLESITPSFLRHFKKTVGELSEMPSPHEAQAQTKVLVNKLTNDSRALTEEAYNQANELVQESAHPVTLENTANALGKVGETIQHSRVPTADQKHVATQLVKLKRAGQSPELQAAEQAYAEWIENAKKATAKLPQNMQDQALAAAEAQFLKENPGFKALQDAPLSLPTKQVHASITSLNAQVDPTQINAKNMISPVTKALQKDLEFAHPEYAERTKEAGHLYRTLLVNGVKSEVMGVFHKPSTTELIVAETKTPEGVRAVKDALLQNVAPMGGKFAEGFETIRKNAGHIWDIIRQATLKRVLHGVEQGAESLIGTDGKMNLPKLAKLSTDLKLKEMLEELLTPKQMKELGILGEIATEAQSSARVFSNPSGTAITAKDWALILGLMHFKWHSGAAIGATRGLSWVLSKPEITHRAVQVALARQKNAPIRRAKSIQTLSRGVQTLSRGVQEQHTDRE